jgi:hypothetical protein
MCYSLPCLPRPILAHPSLPPSICSRRVDDQYPAKSHGIISFTDPYPLTLLESYRFKNRGRGGPFLYLSVLYPILCLRASCGQPVSHSPYTLPSSVSLNPFSCHSYENTRGVGYSSLFGTRYSIVGDSIRPEFKALRPSGLQRCSCPPVTGSVFRAS